MSVATEQRHTRHRPCLICGGHAGLPSGQGIRCAGYMSSDGKWCFCQRVSEGAHHEVQTATGTTYVHLIRDESKANGWHPRTLIHRRPEAILRDISALEIRAEVAGSADEYEADRAELKALEAELAEASRPPEIGTVWLGLDAMAKPAEPVAWLCKGLKLAPGAVNCLAGYGYSGKTAIAQALILSMITGKPLFGLFDVPQVPVIWFDYEQGLRMSASRMQRQARGLGVDLSQYPNDSIRYAEFPDIYLTEKGEGLDKVARLVDGRGFCVMDSARALTPGVDENDSRIRIPFDGLSRISQKTGCVFLVIHHFGKSGDGRGGSKPMKERMRGSSALFDAMQVSWGLEVRDGEDFVRFYLSKDRVTNEKPELKFGVRFIDNAEDDSVVLRHLDKEQMRGTSLADLYNLHVLATIKANQANQSFPSVESIRHRMPDGFKRANECRGAVRELQSSGKLTLVNGSYRAT